MGKTKRSRRRGSRVRDRRKTDSGGSVMEKIESPFKWTWRHDQLPNYLVGKVTGKGPGLKESVKETFTWEGIHNKGGRRRKRRTRRRRRRKRRARGRCRRRCCTRKRRRR